MELTTEELLALGAALEIALHTSGIREAMHAIGERTDDPTVVGMLRDWRLLRARIASELQP